MKAKKLNLVIWSVLGLTALALLLFATPGEAQAKTRVRATVYTPHGSVHIGNGPAPVQVRRVRLPQRRVVVPISNHDRKIAKRLARYTGVPKREILSLKRMGYSWREIGRWLDVPRYVVRAAKTKRSWKRLMREQGVRHAYNMNNGGWDHGQSGCRGNIKHGGRVYDEGYYYDDDDWGDDDRYEDRPIRRDGRRYSYREKTPR